MEAKILAATLVTLAAAFSGLNGGAFTADDIRNTELADQQLTQQRGLQSLLPDIPLLDQLTQRPEPNNKVKAQIEIKDDSNLKLRKAKLTANNLTEIKSNQMNIDSDQDIQFRDFTGEIHFKNGTKMEGTSTGLNTSGVNLTTVIQLETKVSTNRIEAVNTQRTKLKFPEASIQPTKNSSFGINAENTKVKINSFTGDITVYPGNETLIIDGKVDTLQAGKYSLGSQ